MSWYNGTEDAYEDMTRKLINVEQKALSLNLVPALSIHEQEHRTADILLPKKEGSTPDIAHLLDLANQANAVQRVIYDALRFHAPAEESPLYIRRIDGVFLPP